MQLSLKTKIIIGACAVLLAALFALAALIPPPAERVFTTLSGYTLTYPGNWIVVSTGRDSSFEAESIREPKGRATVSIAVHQEPRLTTRGGRVAVGSEIEAGFRRSGEYQLDFFEWLNPDIGAPDNGYVATGSFTYDSIVYDFKEVGLLESTGSKTVFRSEIISAFSPQLGPQVDNILLSIESRRPERSLFKPLTAEEAIERVRGLPSIVLFSADGLHEGKDFNFEVEDDEDAWSVRMFVSGEQRSQKMLVQRWKVDKATGFISKTVL